MGFRQREPDVYGFRVPTTLLRRAQLLRVLDHHHVQFMGLLALRAAASAGLRLGLAAPLVQVVGQGEGEWGPRRGVVFGVLPKRA